MQADLNRFDEAVAHIERARAIYERALGPDHPKMAVTLWSLADVRRKQGHLDDAMTAAARCLAIREKAFTPEHPLVGEALIMIGEIELQRGRLAEALPPLRRALAIAERGSDALNLAQVRLDLARALGHTPEARAFAVQARDGAAARGARGAALAKDAQAVLGP
jgi:tetratricopeptide (TPR) repeat protein